MATVPIRKDSPMKLKLFVTLWLIEEPTKKVTTTCERRTAMFTWVHLVTHGYIHVRINIGCGIISCK